MLNKLECIQLLKQDVIPALGCTEPVCVALCLANASKVLDEEILSIECNVNIGIFNLLIYNRVVDKMKVVYPFYESVIIKKPKKVNV